jgi:cell division septum initiation protein DivIVA
MTRSVIVDRDSVLELVDQLRVAIPEEVRAAKRINAEGERIIEKANDEADRILGRAQEQAAFLIEERGLAQVAEAEGRRIVGEAEFAAEETRRGADEYAAGILISLEGEVVKALQAIKKGIAVLDERRAVLAETEEPAGVGMADDEDVDEDVDEFEADDYDDDEPDDDRPRR